MTSLIKAVDGYAIGLGDAVKGLHVAVRMGNALDVTESTLETGGGISYLSYYVTLIEKYLPKFSADFARGFSFTAMLGYAGVVASAFFMIKESLSLIRQISFIRIFNHHAWKENPKSLLKDLIKRNPLLLQRALPVWLRGKNNLNQLLQGDKQEAIQKLDQIRSYAIKKAIWHAVAVVGFALGVVSGVCLAMAFPPSILFFLMGVAVAFAVGKYILKYGYVENPDGGFSLMKCFPEWIQAWKKRRDAYQQWMHTYPGLLTTPASGLFKAAFID